MRKPAAVDNPPKANTLRARTIGGTSFVFAFDFLSLSHDIVSAEVLPSSFSSLAHAIIQDHVDWLVKIIFVRRQVRHRPQQTSWSRLPNSTYFRCNCDQSKQACPLMRTSLTLLKVDSIANEDDFSLLLDGGL